MVHVRQAMARWYVFQSRHDNEFLAEKQLNRQHFETFVPTQVVEKTRKGVLIGHETRAYFRGYGFVRFNITTDHWRPICTTYGVKRLFFSTSPEHPICVPEGVVESLQVAMQVPMDVVDTVQADEGPIGLDDTMEVLSGPMAGHLGTVAASEAGRVVLLMHIMQSQLPVTFKRNNVRRREDGPATISRTAAAAATTGPAPAARATG